MDSIPITVFIVIFAFALTDYTLSQRQGCDDRFWHQRVRSCYIKVCNLKCEAFPQAVCRVKRIGTGRCAICVRKFYHPNNTEVTSCELTTHHRRVAEANVLRNVVFRHPGVAAAAVAPPPMARAMETVNSFRSAGPGDVAEVANCPPGVTPMDCMPLCNTTCPNYPNAVCRVNRCGTCRAEFFVDGEQVNCYGKRCGVGVAIRTNCDTCSNSYCPRYPQAECRMNPCGKCVSEFVYRGTVVDCGKPNLYAACPNNEPRFRCYSRPCSFETCPFNVSVACQLDNCGGCKPQYLRKFTGEPAECPGYWSDYPKRDVRDRPATEAEIQQNREEDDILLGVPNVSAQNSGRSRSAAIERFQAQRRENATPRRNRRPPQDFVDHVQGSISQGKTVSRQQDVLASSTGSNKQSQVSTSFTWNENVDQSNDIFLDPFQDPEPGFLSPIGGDSLFLDISNTNDQSLPPIIPGSSDFRPQTRTHPVNQKMEGNIEPQSDPVLPSAAFDKPIVIESSPPLIPAERNVQTERRDMAFIEPSQGQVSDPIGPELSSIDNLILQLNQEIFSMLPPRQSQINDLRTIHTQQTDQNTLTSIRDLAKAEVVNVPAKKPDLVKAKVVDTSAMKPDPREHKSVDIPAMKHDVPKAKIVDIPAKKPDLVKAKVVETSAVKPVIREPKSADIPAMKHNVPKAKIVDIPAKKPDLAKSKIVDVPVVKPDIVKTTIADTSIMKPKGKGENKSINKIQENNPKSSNKNEEKKPKAKTTIHAPLQPSPPLQNFMTPISVFDLFLPKHQPVAIPLAAWDHHQQKQEEKRKLSQ